MEQGFRYAKLKHMNSGPHTPRASSYMFHANVIGRVMNNTMETLMLLFCGHLAIVHHKCNSFMLIRDTVHQSWIISVDE